MSFIETGYGYRLQQNLEVKKLPSKGDFSEQLKVTSQNVLNSKINTSNPNSKNTSFTTAAPRYAPMTYQPLASSQRELPKISIEQNLMRQKMHIIQISNQQTSQDASTRKLSTIDHLRSFALNSSGPGEYST